LIREFSLKSIFNDIVSFVFFQKELNLFHQLTKKLICIALDQWIDRDALVGDKRFAELVSVHASLVTVFESRKNRLELIDLITLYVLSKVSALNS
jgi:hypothetical protein